MDFEQIITELADGVLTITLNRPERLNAWTAQMGLELRTAFDQADGDDDVRAVIVTGAGRGFCAGADLASGGDTFDARKREAVAGAMRDNGGELTLRIFECKKPVIAAINGPAVGVGATMTLPMDIRLAAEDARIGFVFARRGIIPEACFELVPAARRGYQSRDGVGGDWPRVLSAGGARRRARAQLAPQRPVARRCPRAGPRDRGEHRACLGGDSPPADVEDARC